MSNLDMKMTLGFASQKTAGPEIVTDGGFDNVTEAADSIGGIDFEDGWSTTGSATIIDADSFDSGAGVGGVVKGLSLIVGDTYKVVIVGTTGAPQLDIRPKAAAGVYKLQALSGGGSTTYFTALDDGLYLRNSGGGLTDITSLTLQKVTLSDWIAGAGWAPHVTAGALSGKANKIAASASDLEQDISVIANTINRNSFVATRTAGTLTPQVGGTNGTVISSDGSYSEDVTTVNTGNLKYQADATFAGTIDTVSTKQLFG